MGDILETLLAAFRKRFRFSSDVAGSGAPELEDAVRTFVALLGLRGVTRLPTDIECHCRSFANSARLFDRSKPWCADELTFWRRGHFSAGIRVLSDGTRGTYLQQGGAAHQPPLQSLPWLADQLMDIL